VFGVIAAGAGGCATVSIGVITAVDGVAVYIYFVGITDAGVDVMWCMNWCACWCWSWCCLCSCRYFVYM